MLRFDARTLTWLGSSSSYENDAYFLFVRKDAKVNSIEAARRPGGPPLILGGTGEGATGNDVALMLRDALGLNIRLITGYPGGGSVYIAVDRGEVDGRLVGISATQSSHPQWLAPNSNMLKLLQFARVTRHQDYPDMPTARELALDDDKRALIELAELPYRLSRPFAAPPGLPPERAKALQTAFLAVHRDPLYLADADTTKDRGQPDRRCGGAACHRRARRCAAGDAGGDRQDHFGFCEGEVRPRLRAIAYCVPH